MPIACNGTLVIYKHDELSQVQQHARTVRKIEREREHRVRDHAFGPDPVQSGVERLHIDYFRGLPSSLQADCHHLRIMAARRIALFLFVLRTE